MPFIVRRWPSILAAALIAIGVGAAGAVYSVRQAIAPDSLPYPTSDRLVTLPAASRRAIRTLDPDLAIVQAGPLGATLARTLAIESFLQRTLLAFGFTGLVLTALGLYATASHRMEARTREFGVRLALGATPRHVGRLAMRQALATAAVAAIAGSAGAIWAGYTLQAFLHGISPSDPVALSAGPAVMIVTALLAVAAPALRAARTNPVDALTSG